MSNLDDQFQDYTPEVSDKEIEQSLKRIKPMEGVYLAKSLKGSRGISDAAKSGKGKAMYIEELVLLRPSDQVASATTVKKWHILPIVPRSEWLISAGYDPEKVATLLANFDADGPKKMFLNQWRGRLRAGFGKEAFPDYPKPVEGSNWKKFTLADGSEVDEAGAATAKGEMIKAVKLAAHSAMKGPEDFTKEQLVYITIGYDKDKETKQVKSDFPSVGYFYSFDNPPKNEDGTYKTVLDPFVSVK